MSLAMYREDLDKQRNGAPIHVGEATFYVRRWGTPESLRVRKELARALWGPLHRASEGNDAELLAHWLAEYAVTGWDDLRDEGGELVVYTREAARAIFLDDAYWLSLNDLLFRGAAAFENYLAEDAEASTEAIKKP